MGKIKTVIGLTGKMGSGKDTVGKYLVDKYGFTRIGFADGVREEVEDSLIHNELPSGEDEWLGMPDDVKEAWVYSNIKHVWEKPTKPAMRTLLQWWGTEFRRAQDPDYWVKYAERKMKEGNYVFTDVRFKNEAELVWKYDTQKKGTVWLIMGRETKNDGIKGHASEVIDFPFDISLDNSGDLWRLHADVDAEMDFFEIDHV